MNPDKTHRPSATGNAAHSRAQIPDALRPSINRLHDLYGELDAILQDIQRRHPRAQG